jgi:hypothetical protein
MSGLERLKRRREAANEQRLGKPKSTRVNLYTNSDFKSQTVTRREQLLVDRHDSLMRQAPAENRQDLPGYDPVQLMSLQALGGMYNQLNSNDTKGLLTFQDSAITEELHSLDISLTSLKRQGIVSERLSDFLASNEQQIQEILSARSEDVVKSEHTEDSEVIDLYAQTASKVLDLRKYLISAIVTHNNLAKEIREKDNVFSRTFGKAEAPEMALKKRQLKEHEKFMKMLQIRLSAVTAYFDVVSAAPNSAEVDGYINSLGDDQKSLALHGKLIQQEPYQVSEYEEEASAVELRAEVSGASSRVSDQLGDIEAALSDGTTTVAIATSQIDKLKKLHTDILRTLREQLEVIEGMAQETAAVAQNETARREKWKVGLEGLQKTCLAILLGSEQLPGSSSGQTYTYGDQSFKDGDGNSKVAEKVVLATAGAGLSAIAVGAVWVGVAGIILASAVAAKNAINAEEDPVNAEKALSAIAINQVRDAMKIEMQNIEDQAEGLKNSMQQRSLELIASRLRSIQEREREPFQP